MPRSNTNTIKSLTCKWFENSNRWKEKFKEILRSEESEITWVGNICYRNDAKFCIAKGIDGTEIFLGFRNDGTEIAIKRISKLNNFQLLKNEEKILRLPQLDDPLFAQYKDFVEDDHFGYLCLQLFEYTLEEYIRFYVEDKDKDKLLQIVRSILKCYKILHDQNPPIFHWDLKPQNFWIDVIGRVRLSGFGLLHWSPEEETTLYTARAEGDNWNAIENSTGEDNTPPNFSTDILGAGMLINYILSKGQHQYHISIHPREYNLVQDPEGVLAKDLIEWMTDENPDNRPGMQNCLCQPLFWSKTKRLEYLVKIGNIDEVAMFKKASQDFISAMEAYAKEGYFRGWKDKFPADLVQKMDGKKKEPTYTDNGVALLRFIRNRHEHYPEYIKVVDVISAFPLLFGCTYKFAKSQGWNSDPRLKHLFITEEAFSSLPETSEEDLSFPVQESQQVFARPFTLQK